MTNKPKRNPSTCGDIITSEESLLLARCYDEGRRAYGTKKKCPYPSDGSGRRMRWWDGYLTARSEPLLQAAIAGARARAEHARQAEATNQTPHAPRAAHNASQETTNG